MKKSWSTILLKILPAENNFKVYNNCFYPHLLTLIKLSVINIAVDSKKLKILSNFY